MPAGLPALGDSEADVELAGPAEPEPTEQDFEIARLHAGGKSHAAISEMIWGYKSSNKYPDIDAAIARVQRAK